MIDKKEFVEEFELIRNTAELKALSSVSLERELTEEEYKKMMELKSKVLGG
ncbi:MAG: hypothetical protein AABY22_02980 [Nanoarchaeota archaeon]